MNAFMAQVNKDVDNIFMNQNELAEERFIDGKSMLVIVDTHRLAEMKLKSQYAEELYDAKLLICVKPSDLGYRPAIGGYLTVDDDCYRVVQVSGEALYQIILGDRS